MLVATLGKIPLFLLCSLSLSGSSSSPVLGDAMPLSRQSPDTQTGRKKGITELYFTVSTRNQRLQMNRTCQAGCLMSDRLFLKVVLCGVKYDGDKLAFKGSFNSLF